MADNTGDGVTVETGSSVTAQASGAGSTGESASDVIRALKKRAQEAEAKLADVAAKEEAARQDKLRAAGQFEELEKGLKSELETTKAENARLAKIASEHEAREEAERKRTIEALPEAQREYAASLPADKLPGFVAALGGTKTPPPKIGEPGAAIGAGKASPEEVRANAGNKAWFEANKHRI